MKVIVARMLPFVKKLVRELMFKKLLSVGGFTLLSRITGFVRDMLLAWTLGAGILSDAFFVAFLFPNYFRAIFGEGTINPAFLPRYAALACQRRSMRTPRASPMTSSPGRWRRRSCCWRWRPCSCRRSCGCWRRAGRGEQFGLTVSLARITFPYLIMTLVAVQLSAMLNAIDRFWAGAFWSNLQNLAMIATLSGVALVSPMPPMPPPGACLPAAWRN